MFMYIYIFECELERGKLESLAIINTLRRRIISHSPARECVYSKISSEMVNGHINIELVDDCIHHKLLSVP